MKHISEYEKSAVLEIRFKNSIRTLFIEIFKSEYCKENYEELLNNLIETLKFSGFQVYTSHSLENSSSSPNEITFIVEKELDIQEVILDLLIELKYLFGQNRVINNTNL